MTSDEYHIAPPPCTARRFQAFISRADNYQRTGPSAARQRARAWQSMRQACVLTIFQKLAGRRLLSTRSWGMGCFLYFCHYAHIAVKFTSRGLSRLKRYQGDGTRFIGSRCEKYRRQTQAPSHRFPMLRAGHCALLLLAAPADASRGIISRFSSTYRNVDKTQPITLRIT